jgi:thymidine kinase
MVLDNDRGNLLLDYMRFLDSMESLDISVVLVDEAQFLTREQVEELGEIVDRFDIPVMAYGLRTDSFGNLFEGSRRLFEIADKFQEFKTICPCCGGKAIFNMRIDDATGKPVFEGDQVAPGNNYLPVCRKYYKELKEQYN